MDIENPKALCKLLQTTPILRKWSNNCDISEKYMLILILLSLFGAPSSMDWFYQSREKGLGLLSRARNIKTIKTCVYFFCFPTVEKKPKTQTTKKENKRKHPSIFSDKGGILRQHFLFFKQGLMFFRRTYGRQNFLFIVEETMPLVYHKPKLSIF